MTADQIPLSALVPKRLKALGVDVPRVLRLAEVAPDAFASGKARLSTRQFFRLWQAVEEVSGDPAIGLRLGGEAAVEHYDVASVAALHSANLGAALRKLARYKRLVCPEEVTLALHGREAHLRFRWLLADDHPPALVTDGAFARALALARRGSGEPLVPLRIELTRRPAHKAMLARHFGCELRFNALHDVMVFDAATLDQPFLTHNDDLLDTLLPGLEGALAEHAEALSFPDQVAAVLGRDMRGQRPSVEAVAKALFVSPRTLQRKLGQAGTSYQQLLDRARQASARHLLASTDLDTGEIAFLLGFEELNSFTRAFQGWEGTTPHRWRDGVRH